jgi:hypothetical protein
MNKEPFHWTIDEVAKCAQLIAEKYRTSELWSDHLYKEMVLEYIKQVRFEELHSQLIYYRELDSDFCTVKKDKLEQLIKFLYNYQHPQV